MAVSLAVLPAVTSATTVYRVRMDTSDSTGKACRLVLDFTSAGSPVNHVLVGAFTTDARLGKTEWQGGPVSGWLASGVGSLAATIRASEFSNELGIVCDSLGTHLGFDLQLSEVAPSGGVPDQLSMFLLDRDESPALPSADPLGANALFAVDVTGLSGGDLSVFAPMQFVAPDTLRLARSGAGVVGKVAPRGPLRILGTSPRPFQDHLVLAFETPPPGGLVRLLIYDLKGRLVAEPLHEQRAPGQSSASWDGREGRGHLAEAGVYVAELQMDGQSVVRRVVLER